MDGRVGWQRDGKQASKMNGLAFDLAFLEFRSSSLACDLGPGLLLFTRARLPKQSLHSTVSCLPATCTDGSMNLAKMTSLSTRHLARAPRPQGTCFWNTRSGSIVLWILPSNLLAVHLSCSLCIVSLPSSPRMRCCSHARLEAMHLRRYTAK